MTAGGFSLSTLGGSSAGGEIWPQVKLVGIVFGRWMDVEVRAVEEGSVLI